MLALSNIIFLKLIYLRILRFARINKIILALAPAHVIINLILIITATFIIQLDSVSYLILFLENI
jgi:hypothetical protein